MITYISILRGMNVSGRNMIKMDALRKSYEEMGFRDVLTYVQSGNVIFNSNDMATEKLQQRITGQIKDDFDMEIPVIVLTIDRLKQIILENPFINNSDKDISFLHITFLSSTPGGYDRESIEKKKQNGEYIVFSDEAVYLYCPNGYGKTKLTNSFLEARLKVGATTRNWKTTNELLRIAESVKA